MSIPYDQCTYLLTPLPVGRDTVTNSSHLKLELEIPNMDVQLTNLQLLCDVIMSI